MDPKNIRRLLDYAVNPFRFSFDLERQQHGYNDALGRLIVAKKHTAWVLSRADEWIKGRITEEELFRLLEERYIEPNGDENDY